MAGHGGRSFADERRLIALAATLKSLGAIASALGRTPKSVAMSAERLGVSLRSQDRKRRATIEPCLILVTEVQATFK
jgi:hypothetical protein